MESRDQQQINIIADGPHLFLSGDKLILEMQCAVCYSVAFEKPLFCQEGHLHCSDCQPKLIHCSVCCSKQTNCQNVTMERLPIRSIACHNQPYGCTYQAEQELLNKHSILCQYALVGCIALKTNGDCKWTGCLKDYLDHLKSQQMKEKINCALPMRRGAMGTFFSFYFRDSSLTQSCFSNCTDKYYPLLLISPELQAFCIHVIIHRTPNGQWNFSVCSLASEQLCPKLYVTIQILPINPDAAKASRQHTFSVRNSLCHIKEKRMMDDLVCQSLGYSSILFKLRVYVFRASDNQEGVPFHLV